MWKQNFPVQNFFSRAKIKILTWQVNVGSLDRVSEFRNTTLILGITSKINIILFSLNLFFCVFITAISYFARLKRMFVLNLFLRLCSEFISIAQTSDAITIYIKAIRNWKNNIGITITEIKMITFNGPFHYILKISQWIPVSLIIHTPVYCNLRSH